MLTCLCFEITGDLSKIPKPRPYFTATRSQEWGTVHTEAPQDASVLGILAGKFGNPKLCRNTIHK